MNKLIKILIFTIAIIIFFGVFTATAPIIFVEKEGNTIVIVADKTAQWTNQEAREGYDLKIHGWSEWETAAYMGFTLPSDFNTEGLTKVEIVLDTISASSSGEAYIYATEYATFENGQQYEGKKNAPVYTAKEIQAFKTPKGAETTEINITEYIKTLATEVQKVAFRIDVKSQDLDGFKWIVGSLTNTGKAPKLVFTYDNQNFCFSKGMDKWTVEGTAQAVEQKIETYADVQANSRVSRLVEGLENGYYTLEVKVKRTDLKESAYVYAKTTNIPINTASVAPSGTWRKTVIQGIKISDGKCEIGLCGKGQFTDVKLIKEEEPNRSEFLVGGDISEVTYVESCGGVYRDETGKPSDPIQLLAERGFNFARIRVYNNPGRGNGETVSWQDNEGNTICETYYLPEGFQNVKDALGLSKRAKDKGMQVELTLYYSDYWADGARQQMPHKWAEKISELQNWNEKYDRLKELMYEYTKEVLLKLKEQNTIPEYISLGNEMQGGLLYDAKGTYNYGGVNNFSNLAGLLNSAARAVREIAPETKIVLHLDGTRTQYQSFFDNCEKYSVDYDIIGPSYYPFWSGDTVDTVVNFYNWLIKRYDKDILVMETGYNFSPEKASGGTGQLANNGPYNSIYPSTPVGQRAFMEEVFQGLRQVAGGRCIGDLYWDPMMINQEGVGWAMVEGKDGGQDYVADNLVSNTTLFDFDGKALPVFDAFKNNGYRADTIGIGGTITDEKGDRLKNTAITLKVNDKKYRVNTDRFGGYFVRVPYNDSVIVSVIGANAQKHELNMTMEKLKTGLDFKLTEFISEAGGTAENR